MDLQAVVDWFAGSARDLPWRRAPRAAWPVLVSEVMLQQTPVDRVRPVFAEWLERWPTPAALAAVPPADAIHAWGRLGYPRRALRLHAAATAIVRQHGGAVPDTAAALTALPGVGGYTAAAVLAFAFRQRVAVLDTNVRRVVSRCRDCRAEPLTASVSAGERADLLAVLPQSPPAAAVASEALMELGALVCLARAPQCEQCPLAPGCAWRAAGRPAASERARRQPRFEGSDRQVRGRILALLRQSGFAAETDVDRLWPDPDQLSRAKQSLLEDGLIQVDGGLVGLPRCSPSS